LLENIDPKQQSQLRSIGELSDIDVLCWSGYQLDLKLVEFLKPEVAIAFSKSLDVKIEKWFKDNKVQVYWMTQTGAIQWTSNGEFKTTLDEAESDRPLS
jgi:competence protein ComEC